MNNGRKGRRWVMEDSKWLLLLHGKAVPDFDFTNEMSALLIEPSAVTSSRKLELSTTWPDCDLVWLISAELTEPSAVVSPMSTLIDPATAGLKLPAESATLLKLTVIICPLVTPVKLTTYCCASLGSVALLLTLPT